MSSHHCINLSVSSYIILLWLLNVYIFPPRLWISQELRLCLIHLCSPGTQRRTWPRKSLTWSFFIKCTWSTPHSYPVLRATDREGETRSWCPHRPESLTEPSIWRISPGGTVTLVQRVGWDLSSHLVQLPNLSLQLKNPPASLWLVYCWWQGVHSL